ncbi:MAG: radical SAM protein [Bacteroidia bacterium]|nr:radical SAM protein [Bacteroidia bacterium]
MLLKDIPNNTDHPVMLPFEGKDVPHLIIEVNQKCNITCRACYKSKFDYTKPLEEIKSEVDFAVSRRNLHVITLAGGEPSLHPKLPEVIKYIAQKGVMVQMLSNGFALTDNRLEQYKEAGLFKVFLHIDSQQQRPDVERGASENELNALRTKISNKILAHGIKCGLEVTLYQDSLKDFPAFVDYYLKSSSYQWLLVTCCCDSSKIAEKFGMDGPHKLEVNRESLIHQQVTNKEVLYSLYGSYKMLPYAYIASSDNSEDMRWLIYFSFSINKRNGKAKILHVKPSFRRLAILGNMLHQKKFGTYSFDVVWTEFQTLSVCFLYGLVSLNIITFFQTMGFLLNLLLPASKITYKLTCFQQGPNLTSSGGIEYCKACPDITVRNGKLIPVCMVDILSEMPKNYKASLSNIHGRQTAT